MSDKILSMFGLMTIAEHDLEIAINKRQIIEYKKESLLLRTKAACAAHEVETFNKMCGLKTMEIVSLNRQLEDAKKIMSLSIIKPNKK